MRVAVTFGTKYADNSHPVLGELAHPDGYIVVEGRDMAQILEFLPVICGREQRPPGSPILTGGAAPLYAFDYPLEDFEKPGGTAETFHPRGRTAIFSTLPYGQSTVQLRAGTLGPTRTELFELIEPYVEVEMVAVEMADKVLAAIEHARRLV